MFVTVGHKPPPYDMTQPPNKAEKVQAYSLAFLTVNCNKSNSATNDSVIRPPTKEKYLMPRNNGQSEITIATSKIYFALIAVRAFPFMQYTAINTKIKQLITAVINGAKFA